MAEMIVEREISDGEFRRQQSVFSDWVGVDPRTGRPGALPTEHGR